MSVAAATKKSPKPTSTSTLVSTQLLPDVYFARKHARRVFCIWLFVVFSAASAMCGVLGPVWLRGQRIRGSNSQLVGESKPLADLVRKINLLELANQQQSKWSQWVESAKPDDSLLQTMAAAAQATKPAESEIEIDTLEIQLPLEYPPNLQGSPKWGTPHLSLTAKVHDGITVRSWLERISASDRIDDAGSKLAPSSWKGGTIHVTAKPIATRVLP